MIFQSEIDWLLIGEQSHLMQQIWGLEGAKIVNEEREKLTAERIRRFGFFSSIGRMVVLKRCCGQMEWQIDKHFLYRFAEPKLFSLGKRKRQNLMSIKLVPWAIVKWLKIQAIHSSTMIRPKVGKVLFRSYSCIFESMSWRVVSLKDGVGY